MVNKMLSNSTSNSCQRAFLLVRFCLVAFKTEQWDLEVFPSACFLTYKKSKALINHKMYLNIVTWLSPPEYKATLKYFLVSVYYCSETWRSCDLEVGELRSWFKRVGKVASACQHFNQPLSKAAIVPTGYLCSLSHMTMRTCLGYRQVTV